MLDRGYQALAAMASLAALALLARAWRRRNRALGDLNRGLDDVIAGWRARPIQVLPSGGLGRVVRTFNRLIPRLEARLATLEADRGLLGAVLGGMTEGVIAIDARRRLLFANEAAERLFGLGTDSVGRLVAELIRNPKVQEAVDATLSRKIPHPIELEVAGPDSRPLVAPRTLALQGTPLPGSPNPGAVLVFHDVTDLRRLERMRQDFVANASHELKTPLAAIKAYTETLIDGALHDDEVNVRFLGQIDEQADRLNRLILDLLSLARLESGQDLFHHDPLPFSSTVHKIAETHRERARSRDLAFSVDLPDSDAWVRADEEALRQILDNLIDNAIKYTPEGGRIAITGVSEPGRVVVNVADSGIGIPRDDLPRVFERFYRVDKARSRELGGTGLGLSIVKHLVQSLGGQVAVESRPGLGTTFRVVLPRTRDVGSVPPEG